MMARGCGGGFVVMAQNADTTQVIGSTSVTLREEAPGIASRVLCLAPAACLPGGALTQQPNRQFAGGASSSFRGWWRAQIPFHRPRNLKSQSGRTANGQLFPSHSTRPSSHPHLTAFLSRNFGGVLSPYPTH